MQFEETYIVETKHADGLIDVDPYDNIYTALAAYDEAAEHCGRGESVKLHRTTSVVIASRARA
jgi:hypothetical protein